MLMSNYRIILLPFLLLSLMTLTGCWSSKEIEDLSLYLGMAIDKGDLTSVEKGLENKGGAYDKKNVMTITVQVIPTKTGKGESGKGKGGGERSSKYYNVTETGDSVLQIFNQFGTKRDRPLIGHHLKAIVISDALLKDFKIEQLMELPSRDNDIRPSCIVFISDGEAKKTFEVGEVPGDIPAFHLRSMIRNRSHSNKILPEVTLSRLDGMIHSHRSFILQNIITAEGRLQLSGAGIIKGSTGKWIGKFNQDDVEAIGWIKGNGLGGTLKYYANDTEPVIYEIMTMKSNIQSIVDGDSISFHVRIESEGQILENWDTSMQRADESYKEEMRLHFEEALQKKLDNFMEKMQKRYKVETAGFGEQLRIQHPKLWKRINSQWDEIFSDIPVKFEIKLNIKDYGSSMG